MLRLRIRLTDWPRRALTLTDTPRPDCPCCHGEGGHAYDFGDESGEYAGTEWDPCNCWDDTRCWTVLPLPRLPRRTPAGYSDEPPF